LKNECKFKETTATVPLIKSKECCLSRQQQHAAAEEAKNENLLSFQDLMLLADDDILTNL
jgi:hypothetical protein